jgi:hypothetical protein
LLDVTTIESLKGLANIEIMSKLQELNWGENSEKFSSRRGERQDKGRAGGNILNLV